MAKKRKSLPQTRSMPKHWRASCQVNALHRTASSCVGQCLRKCRVTGLSRSSTPHHDSTALAIAGAFFVRALKYIKLGSVLADGVLKVEVLAEAVGFLGGLPSAHISELRNLAGAVAGGLQGECIG